MHSSMKANNPLKSKAITKTMITAMIMIDTSITVKSTKQGVPGTPPQTV